MEPVGIAPDRRLNLPSDGTPYWNDPFDVSTPGYKNERLTIPAGSASIEIPFIPVTDTITEGEERALFVIAENRNAPGSYTFDPSINADVRVQDGAGPQIVSIEATDPTGSELGDDPAFFTVRAAATSRNGR